VVPKSTRSPKQGAQERIYATRVHHNHFFGSHGSFVYVVLRLSAGFAKIMLVEMPERVFLHVHRDVISFHFPETGLTAA